MDKIFDIKSDPNQEDKLNIQISDDSEFNLKKVIKPNEKKTKQKYNHNPDNTNNNLCVIM